MSVDAISWAFRQNVKPAAKKFVLIALADNADQYGICFPSYKHVQEKTGLSRRAVIDNCKSLIADGLIQKATRERWNNSSTSNAYLLPISNESLVNHPLVSLFEGGAGDAPPLVQEMHPPSAGDAPPSAGDAPLEPSYNHHITKKEKKALTRNEFLREIDKGYTANSFEQFGWLTETEIKSEAEACLDFYGAKDEWPAGDPIIVVRHWLRQGIKVGSIRSKPKESQARQVDQETLQPWQEKAKVILGDKIYRSWVHPLKFDGTNELIAPNKFAAEHLQSNFYRELSEAVGRDVYITYQKQKETELCQA